MKYISVVVVSVLLSLPVHGIGPGPFPKPCQFLLRVEELSSVMLKHANENALLATHVSEVAKTYQVALKRYVQGNFEGVIHLFGSDFLGSNTNLVRVFNPQIIHLNSESLTDEGKGIGYFGHTFVHSLLTPLKQEHLEFSPKKGKVVLPIFRIDGRKLSGASVKERAIQRWLAEAYLEEFWVWLVMQSSAPRSALTDKGIAFRDWFVKLAGAKDIGFELTKHANRDDVSSAGLVELFFARADFALMMLDLGRARVLGPNVALAEVHPNGILATFRSNNAKPIDYLVWQMAYLFALDEGAGVEHTEVFQQGEFPGLDDGMYGPPLPFLK